MARMPLLNQDQGEVIPPAVGLFAGTVFPQLVLDITSFKESPPSSTAND
jgi:hypothetical protein